jgi:hypothetical protein
MTQLGQHRPVARSSYLTGGQASSAAPPGRETSGFLNALAYVRPHAETEAGWLISAQARDRGERARRAVDLRDCGSEHWRAGDTIALGNHSGRPAASGRAGVNQQRASPWLREKGYRGAGAGPPVPPMASLLRRREEFPYFREASSGAARTCFCSRGGPAVESVWLPGVSGREFGVKSGA